MHVESRKCSDILSYKINRYVYKINITINFIPEIAQQKKNHTYNNILKSLTCIF